MTTINSLDDFLQALDDNPQWLEAVRSRILGDELKQMPARFNAFVDRVEAFMERTEGFMHRTEEFMVRMQRFVEEQTAINTRLIQRMDRMESDFSVFKGDYARQATLADAWGIARDMGLEYVRTLSKEDLGRLAENALDNESLRERRDQLRSFRNADLIIETKDGAATKYVAIEISFTADHRETDRAERNARTVDRVHRSGRHPRRRQRPKRQVRRAPSGAGPRLLAPPGRSQAVARVTPSFSCTRPGFGDDCWMWIPIW